MAKWSNLGVDLVTLIEDSVVLYIDKVRFRAVCSSWNSFPPKIPNHNLKQLPWLFQALDQNDDKFKDATHVVFNLLDKKHYFLDLADQVSEKDFRLFYKSWAVVTEKYGRNPIVHLLNPLTGYRINLPGLNFTGYDDLVFLPNKSCVYRVVYSSNPLEDDCVMFALNENDGSTVFCKRNDLCWNVLVSQNETQLMPNDIIFHKGKLHALIRDDLIVFDDIAPNSSFRRIAEKISVAVAVDPLMLQLQQSLGFSLRWSQSDNLSLSFCRFLVESSDEKELMLLEKDGPDRMFQVYKHDTVNLKWLKVKSIGDEVIFAGERKTSPICISCRDLPAEFMGNRIYLTDRLSKESQLKVFNLDDDTIESMSFENFPMGMNSDLAWFSPGFY